MTNWIQWLTLSFAGVGAAGGITSSVISTRAQSQENQRIWERDRVTERYTQFYSALQGVQRAYVQSVERRFGDPSPPPEDPYGAIEDAFGVVSQRWAETYVVARPRMARLMNTVFTVDITVLAPHSPNGVMPPIAQERLFAERDHLAELLALLPRAMRADLGRLTKDENWQIDDDIRGFVRLAPTAYRSAFIDIAPDGIIPNLKAYSVDRLAGGDDNFRVQPDDFVRYREGLPPEVSGAGVHAAMSLSPTDGVVRAGVDAGLPADTQLLRLRQIGRLVESGFRASPGVSGYRRIADGSHAWIWTAASPNNVVDETAASFYYSGADWMIPD